MDCRNEAYMACDLSADFQSCELNEKGRPLRRAVGKESLGDIRTIARWKSGLLPLEVFAMRVNWDTQRISPCMSLTFAFHMSPEGLENTFRDSLRCAMSQPALVQAVSESMRDDSTHIFLVRFSMSEALSSVCGGSQIFFSLTSWLCGVC
jgi:hypothetical protein